MISRSLLVLCTVFTLSFTTNPGDGCCAAKEAKAAKCTGSKYCTACKNCKYCKHCTNGGSCGVCNPPKKKKG